MRASFDGWASERAKETVEQRIVRWRLFYGGWIGLLAFVTVLGFLVLWVIWLRHLIELEHQFTGGKPIWLMDVTQYQAMVYGLSLASRAGVLLCIITVGFGVARYVTRILAPASGGPGVVESDEMQRAVGVLERAVHIGDIRAG